MPISEGFREIEEWASSAAATKTAPDDATLDPALTVADGWPATFSSDGGNTPRRGVMNWLFNRITAALIDIRSQGVLPYDAEVDTLSGGVRIDGGKLWRATENVGPTWSNAVAPSDAAQTVWSELRGSLGLPGTPSAPTATAPATGELRWTWICPLDGGAAVTEFEFRWRLAGSMTWTTVSPTTATAILTQTGLTNGQDIEAQVRAMNSQGWGEWSPTGTGTPAGTRPGGGPTLALQAVAADTSVVLSWLEPDDGGLTITQYTIQWRTGSQAFSSGRQATSSSAGATVGSLTNDVEYFFQVRATNSQGAGPWSNEASATPTEPAATSAVPDRAAAPTGTAGQGTATWAWLPPSDNNSDITSFEFRFRTTGSGAWTTRTGLTVAARTETSLTNGTSYEAQVRARNGVGIQSSWSPSGSVTPQANVPDRIQHVELDNTVAGITARWGAPQANGSAITGYDVRVANNSAMTAATTHSVNASTTSLALTAVGSTPFSDGNTYYVDVRARNGRGNGARSPAASLLRDDGRAVPNAPVALVGTVTDAVIDWAWRSGGDNGAAISSYDFQWREDTDGWAAANIVAGLTVAYYALSGQTATIEARVRATNSEGTSDWSEVASVATEELVPDTEPRQPAAPMLTRGDRRIAVAWTAPADGGDPITGYDIEYRVSGSQNWVSWPHTGTGRSATITGLLNGRRYDVRVRATNGVGDSQWSPTASAIPATTPSAPGRPTLTAGDSQIAVAWDAPANNGAAITDYDVEYRTGSGAWTDWSHTGTGRTATITGLADNTAYEVRVRATNNVGTSGWSATRSATTAAVPNAPGRPQLTAAGTSIAVAWSAPAANRAPITGYDVEYRVSGAWTDAGHSGTGTSVTITGLTNGVTYEVRVRATNSVGDSEWSPTASATTISPPSAPTAPTLTAGNGRLGVSWAAPTGTGITDYDIRYRRSMASSWTDWPHTGTGRTNAITGLTNGVAYDVQVRARNSAGPGAWSSTRVGTAIGAPTAPDDPVGFSTQPLLVEWRFSPNLSRGAAFTEYEIQWRLDGDAWAAGNVLSVNQPYGAHAVPDASKDVEARARARNSQGWSGWSGTATFAKAGITVPVAQYRDLPESNESALRWGFTDTDAIAIIQARTLANVWDRLVITGTGDTTNLIAGPHRGIGSQAAILITGLAPASTLRLNYSGGSSADLTRIYPLAR